MRIEIVSTYNDEVSLTHRKKFGQFFTDPDVASFMVNWVLESGHQALYDPAFGLGAFFNPVCNLNSVTFVASEIDRKIISYWRSCHQDTTAEIRCEDYLKTWGRHYNNIICNPPYMRFQKFIGREQIFRDFELNLGIRLSGYTNIASAFLVKSLAELQGGRLAYIMPLEFLNAGYGTLIKEKLIENSWLRAIISLDCEKDVFPDVTTSAGIILVDSTSKSSCVDFYKISQIKDIDNILLKTPSKSISTFNLQPCDKWLHYFDCSTIEYDKNVVVPLEYYGRFSRGIATGANEFFVGSANHFNKLGIRDNEVLSCITRSSQIQNSFFTQIDYDSLKSTDAKVLLFSPKGKLSTAALEYIRSGEKAGFHERFLTRNRTPWYKTEVRLPSPLLLGVFSRGGYKVIKNTSNALNLTCYHGFQPNLFGMSYIDVLFLYLLSDAGRQLLSLSMRKYGDSLDKFEPNDLNKAFVPTPVFFNKIPHRVIQDALDTVHAGGKIPDFIQDTFNSILDTRPDIDVHLFPYIAKVKC